jgi:hypothetical protein
MTAERTAIDDLSHGSAPGVYEMKTASGSYYKIVIEEDGSSTSQRIPGPDGFPLRHDAEEWKLKGQMFVAVGYPGIFELEGMGDPEMTIRRTSHVREIFKIS